ncbi:hypothetical protein LCGC14_2942100 [marine sediment metagenome]|uniref:HNH nuclease domain-containing protein n=1 Tax=marine sediment metagenome TaxID=412755 RepID=A0A0F8XI99_9ZZZZ
MPSLIPTRCATSGCPAITTKRRCQRHHQEEQRGQDARRPTATQRGYGWQWRKLRNAVIARDPICTDCGRAPSTDADHKIPRSQGGQDTMENLAGKCHGCHSSKTARRDGGFGNAIKQSDLVVARKRLVRPK